MKVYLIKRLEYFQHVKGEKSKKSHRSSIASREEIGSLNSLSFVPDQLDEKSHTLRETANEQMMTNSHSDMLSLQNHLEEDSKPLQMVVKSKSLFSSVAPASYRSSTKTVRVVRENREPCDQCDTVSLESDIEVRKQSATASELGEEDEKNQKNEFNKYHSKEDNDNDSSNNNNGNGNGKEVLETKSDVKLTKKRDKQNLGNIKENWKKEDDNDDEDEEDNNKFDSTLDTNSMNSTQVEETEIEEEQYSPMETMVLSESKQDQSNSLLAKIRSLSPANLRGRLMRE